jgi:hypothetical protein
MTFNCDGKQYFCDAQSDRHGYHSRITVKKIDNKYKQNKFVEKKTNYQYNYNVGPMEFKLANPTQGLIIIL